MAVGPASGAAAAAAARARAAELARQRAAEAAAKRAAEKAAAAAAAKQAAAAAAAKQAAAAAAAKAKTARPLHPKERPTRNRNAFVDVRPAPIRERPTKNRSAFDRAGATLKPQKAPRELEAINEAAQRSPEAGARALEQRLKKADDAQQREEVLSQSYGALDKITAGLRAPGVTQAQTDQTVAALGGASKLVSKDSAAIIAARLQQGGSPLASPALPLPSFTDTQAAQSRLNTALVNTASKPGVATLAGSVADAHRASGAYDAADAVRALSPKFNAAAAQSPGEAKARAAVEVPTVADARENLEKQTATVRTATMTKANELIALSQKDPAKLPKNVSVEATENGAVLTQKDRSGNVIGRTTAEVDGEKVSLQEESFVKGKARISRVEASAEAVSTTTASYAQAASKAPAAVDLAALEQSRDAAVTLQKQTVTQNGDELVRTDLKQAGGGVSRSDTTYSQHDNTDGLDDNLKDKFSDGAVDFEQTHMHTIPKPGAKGPDGEAAKATSARTQVFSQGDVRATATTGLQLGARESDVPSNAADVASLKETGQKLSGFSGDDDFGEDFDGNKDNPKQWKLEVNSGNTYEAQTFIEGNPDASTVLTRTALGNEIHEEVSGKWFKEDGELGDISGSSSRVWNNNGTLTHLDNTVTDPNGNVSAQTYERTRSTDAQGRAQVETRSVNTEAPADGPEQTAITEQVERGDQLVSARQELHGPGGVAVASINAQGQRLEVNGRPVKDLAQLEKLGGDRAHLGAAAQDGLSQQLQSYSAQRGLDPADLGEVQGTDASKPGDAAGNVEKATRWARSGLNLLQAPLTGVDSKAPSVTFSSQQKLTAFQFSSTALGATASLVGFAGSAANLVDSIRSGDGLDIARAGLMTAGAGAGLVGAGADAFTVTKLGGGAPSSTVSSIAGKFSVGLGVATGGVQVVQGIRDGDGFEIAKGGVAVSGAVGGFLLGGAAAGAWGGPAGIAVGALVGVAAFGVTKGLDALADKEHQIADVVI